MQRCIDHTLDVRRTCELDTAVLGSREAHLHIGDDVLDALGEIRMHRERNDRNAEPHCCSNQCLTDTARNSARLSRIEIEHAERRDHATDRTQETEERRHRDRDAQIIHPVAQLRERNAGLNFHIGGHLARVLAVLCDGAEQDVRDHAALRIRQFNRLLKALIGNVQHELMCKRPPRIHTCKVKRTLNADKDDKDRHRKQEVHNDAALPKKINPLCNKVHSAVVPFILTVTTHVCPDERLYSTIYF